MSIKIKIEVEVSCWKTVPDDSDYVGQYACDCVTGPNEPDNLIDVYEEKTVVLKEYGPNPNLDWMTCRDNVFEFKGCDAKEKVVEESDVYARRDVSVEDIDILVTGSVADWREQVESWCSEQIRYVGGENKEYTPDIAMDYFDSWNKYDWLTLGVPKSLGDDYQLPWKSDDNEEKEIMTDGGQDMTDEEQSEIDSLRRQLDLRDRDVRREMNQAGFDHSSPQERIEFLSLRVYESAKTYITHRTETGTRRMTAVRNAVSGLSEDMTRRIILSEIDSLENGMAGWDNPDKYEDLIELNQMLQTECDRNTKQERKELWDKLLAFSRYKVTYETQFDNGETQAGSREILDQSSTKAHNSQIRRMKMAHGEIGDIDSDVSGRSVDTRVLSLYHPEIAPYGDLEHFVTRTV